METPIAKKRGRKSKDEYYINKKVDNVEIIDKAIILHLPITMEDVQSKESKESISDMDFISPCQVSPYSKNNLYSEIYNIKKNEDYIMKKNGTILNEETYENNIVSIYDLQLLPKELTKDGVTNIKTHIACFWCCHTFISIPVFMPINLHNGIYKVKGCFCSFECCYSYMDDKYRDNIYLLNYMYKDFTKKIGSFKDNIKKAPPRESLNMFGGPMTIEDFRKSNSEYSIRPFPMVYIPNQLEKTKKIIQKEVKSLLPNVEFKNITVEKKIKNSSLGKIIGFRK